MFFNQGTEEKLACEFDGKKKNQWNQCKLVMQRKEKHGKKKANAGPVGRLTAECKWWTVMKSWRCFEERERERRLLVFFSLWFLGSLSDCQGGKEKYSVEWLKWQPLDAYAQMAVGTNRLNAELMLFTRPRWHLSLSLLLLVFRTTGFICTLESLTEGQI